MAEFCIDCGSVVKGHFPKCFRCQLKTARQEGYDLGYQTGFLAGEQARAKTDDLIISPNRWRQLSQLCHPDRHSNSTTSVEITQWLQHIKDKIRSRDNENKT